MYSIMELFLFFSFFFSIENFFFCTCTLDHCSYTFILKGKILRQCLLGYVITLFSIFYPGFNVLIDATPNKSASRGAGIKYMRKRRNQFSVLESHSRSRFRSLLNLRNL